jgi:S-formylglutathione hydrolase FrmB
VFRPDRPSAALLLLLLISVCAPAAAAQREDTTARPAAAQNGVAGRWEDGGTFASASLGRKVRYGVYLPPGYDEEEDRRYPVLYWLHGMFEDHARFDSRGGSTVVAGLYAAGGLAPMIIACPDGGRTSFYANGVESGAHEDLVTKDFVAFVDARYRTIPARASRAIAGTSMGGAGALKIALKHPEIFSAVATHSAALFPVDLDRLPERFKKTLESHFGAHFRAIWGDPIDKRRWAADNPLALAATVDPGSLAGLAIYLDCGDQDRYQFQRVHRELHSILERRRIPHEWHELPGGHGWGDGYLRTYLARSLVFVARRLAPGSAPAPAPAEPVRPQSRPAR